MTTVLGISAFYHDSAAALLVDGRLVAAVQEERFSRIKNDASFPAAAVKFCLSRAGLSVNEIDYIGFFEKPMLKFDRIVETQLAFAPFGLANFLAAMPGWLKYKLRMRDVLNRNLSLPASKSLIFADHHHSHAASAYFPSPFDDAAILTIDGVGEWATTRISYGQKNRISPIFEIDFPHSLGLLYSAITSYCGFRVNFDEYKLMGLAPYGKPVYTNLLLEKIISLNDDGSFWIDMRYFDFCKRLRMTSQRFHRLFGRGPRKPGEPITDLDKDLAASIQQVTEYVLLQLVRAAHERTGSENLCLAGGVALNCVANGKLAFEGPFKRLWIQPAAGDAGGAVGVAFHIWNELLGECRSPAAGDLMNGSLLGPEFTDEECEQSLCRHRLDFQRYSNFDELARVVADRLAGGAIIGWFQGRLEFGPRALGNRSILADPRGSHTREKINLKIKGRESFRPFGPAVLDEFADTFFDMRRIESSPYMLLAVPAFPNATENIDNPGESSRSSSPFPAIVHIDGTSRLQTVDKTTNPRFRTLLEAFYARTSCPMLVNTSFNSRDEPIVATIDDAINAYNFMKLDLLVLGSCVVNSK